MPRLFFASVEGGRWMDVTTTDLGRVVNGSLICGSVASFPARVALMYTATETDGFRLKKVGVTDQPDASSKGGARNAKGDAWTFSGHLGVCGNSTAALLHGSNERGVTIALVRVFEGLEGPMLDSIAFSGQECSSTPSRGKVVCAKRPKPTRRNGAFKGDSNDYEIGEVSFAPLRARKGMVCPGISVSGSLKSRSLQAQSLMSTKNVRFGLQVNLIVGREIYKASLLRCKVRSKARGTLRTVKVACRPA